MPQIELSYTNPAQDGRRKILKSEYKTIKQLYSELHSYQKVADIYGVSKRLIIFIVCPETLQTLQHRNKLNEHWKKYYNTEKHKKYMQVYRAKKRQANLIIYHPTPM